MNIAICDDEKIWQEQLLKLLQRYSFDRDLDIFTFCFSDGKALAESDTRYDIIFMDYKMKGLDGIETSRRIRDVDRDSTIIFVSSYTHVALDAFEVKAYRFLAKPIDKAKLFKALDDYRAEVDSDNFLIYKTHDRVVRIRISDIIYAESDRNYAIIHTKYEDHHVTKNLKHVHKDLPLDKFYRCHKSYLVSFLHVQAHDKTDIFLDDGSHVYISRNFLSGFKQAFHEYILKYNAGEV